MSEKELLKSISIEKDTIDMTIEGGACGVIADAFASQFKEEGAVNYLEMQFNNTELGQIVVTIQRVDGATPCDKLTTITEERDRLREALTKIIDMCVGEIAMGYKIDPQHVGQIIYEATGMNAEQLAALTPKETK